MMGKDCERILGGISSVKESLQDALMTMSGMVNGPMKMKKFKIHHNDGLDEEFELEEKELEATSRTLVSIEESFKPLIPDVDKMMNLKKHLYTDVSSFNNSLGSPWAEIKQLQSVIDQVKEVVTDLKYASQILSIMPLISTAISYAVDAKIALITYHDYIQRGYDAVYNNKRASIQFTTGYARKTVGNISQKYSENVNIEPESIDPF